MGSFWERARWIAAGLALWGTLLVGPAAAQDDTLSPSPNVSVFPAPAPCPCPKPPCRETGNSTPPNLAVPPESWPSTSHGVSDDQFDPLQSNCPNQDDYFILPPRMPWYVRAEGAAITRAPNSGVIFQTISVLPQALGTPPTDAYIALTTNDFRYDFSAAGRLLIGHTINDTLQIEGSYLGVRTATNAEALRDPRQLMFSPFSGFGYFTPITGLDNNSFAQIRYESSFQSAELNIRRQIPMAPEQLIVSALFGIRYFGLPERFHYQTECDAGAADILVNTDNQLVGPQIGALFEFYAENRWWVNLEMKAAVLNNRGSQHTAYDIDAGPYAGTGADGVTEDHTSFAGELNLACIYRWSPKFSTRIGYQAIWLTNMVLAPNNFNRDIDMLTSGPAQLNHRVGTVYHGPFAGIEFAW